MKPIMGILMILAGVAFGIYVGFWICLVGGLVDMVDYFKAGEFFGVLWGGLKFLLAGIAGWLSAGILILPGVALIDD